MFSLLQHLGTVTAIDVTAWLNAAGATSHPLGQPPRCGYDGSAPEGRLSGPDEVALRCRVLCWRDRWTIRAAAAPNPCRGTEPGSRRLTPLGSDRALTPNV